MVGLPTIVVDFRYVMTSQDVGCGSSRDGSGVKMFLRQPERKRHQIYFVKLTINSISGDCSFYDCFC